MDWKSPWQQKHARCACGIPRLDKAPPSSALVSALEGSTGGSENERERFFLVAGTVGCVAECSKTNAHTYNTMANGSGGRLLALIEPRIGDEWVPLVLRV